MPSDYESIEKAILYIEKRAQKQPSLLEVATAVGMSAFHFQRLFKRFAGVSPKRFLQFLTAEHARRMLEASSSALDTAFAAGLSSPGRLFDLMVSVHAMTPGEVRNLGAGLTIRYGFHESPFGECLIAITDRGVCRLTFVPRGRRAVKITDLSRRWPQATTIEDSEGTRSTVKTIFSIGKKRPDTPLNILIKGTNFQIRVWEALLRVPPGCLISYGDLAQRAGFPGASRAAGTAVGQNPLAFLIPCHRVIRATGAFGNYGGGAARKKAILGWEAAHFRIKDGSP